jgi:hypothetical protein
MRSPAPYHERIGHARSAAKLVVLVSLVHLVSLVYPVSLVQPNKRDKPNKPEQPAGSHAPWMSKAMLAEFFNRLLILER